MKKLIVGLVSTIALFGSSIDIEVSGIQSQKGSIFIGLFDSKKSFPKKEAVYKGISIEVNSKIIKYKFEDIPSGTYAISIFHDENNNKKLDKNFLGIPLERYGFSNKARGSCGAPSFNEAKFQLIDILSVKVDIK